MNELFLPCYPIFNNIEKHRDTAIALLLSNYMSYPFNLR